MSESIDTQDITFPAGTLVGRVDQAILPKIAYAKYQIMISCFILFGEMLKACV